MRLIIEVKTNDNIAVIIKDGVHIGDISGNGKDGYRSHTSGNITSIDGLCGASINDVFEQIEFILGHGGSFTVIKQSARF